MSTLSFRDFGLPPSLLKAVEKRARSAGTTARQYVRLLIERDLLAEKSFDEILRPIRADFRKSGISEAELDEIVERARNATKRKPARSRR